MKANRNLSHCAGRAGLALLIAVLGILCPIAPAASVKEIARLEGQGKSVLQGLGLVIGLPGTGDSAEDLVIARPLAKLFENQGNPIANFDELVNSRSVALVMVTCEVPATGARADDQFDAFVSTMISAESLSGGRLFIATLRGPLPGQGVFGFASGPVIIEGDNPATGRVRGGATIVRSIDMQTISPDGTIHLVIDQAYAGWSTTQLFASIINQHRLGLEETGEDIARAITERVVRVRIPDVERPDPANFIADIMGIRFDASLLDLPARIVINEREGAIVATGNVEIGPTLITYRDLIINTAPPTPQGAAQIATPSRWAQVHTGARPNEAARLQDLLTAFRQIDLTVDDQIAIINMLKRSGNLHAEIVVD
jgi:flagellar P-ring protein precursor FlgI